MEKFLEKLKKAIRECAKAHRVEFLDLSEEYQLAVKSESVPVLADMQMICDAFFGTHQCIEVGWGYTNIMYDEVDFLPEIDENLLKMALPSGTVI